MPKKRKAKQRLHDVVVNKISFVDDPAIEEIYAIVKRREESPVSEELNPQETPSEPVEKAASDSVKEAFIKAVADLRKIAGEMDEESLGILSSLMSFTKYRYGYERVDSELDPRLKRLSEAAAWTDEQWATVEKSLSEEEQPAAGDAEPPTEEAPADPPADETPAADPEAGSAPAEDPPAEESPTDPLPPPETTLQKAARLMREEEDRKASLQKANEDQDAANRVLQALEGFDAKFHDLNESLDRTSESLQHATGSVD